MMKPKTKKSKRVRKQSEYDIAVSDLSKEFCGCMVSDDILDEEAMVSIDDDDYYY